MKLVRRSALALVGTVAAWYSPLLGGCVSSTPSAGSLTEDAALPAEDSGVLPTGDSAPPPLKDASQPDSTLPPEDGSAPDSSVVDSNVPDSNVPDTSPAASLIRFAWFVGGQPLLGDGGAATPAALYDVCVAPHGTGAWQGPLLAKASFPTGLNPFDLTAYFTVLAGQYDARVVLAGSANCDLPDAGGPEDAATDGGAPLAPGRDFTSLPALAAGGALTVVFVDPGSTSTTFVDAFAFADDTTTSAGQAKVRFLNVSESDGVVANTVDAGLDAAGVDAGTSFIGADLGIGGGVVFTPLFTNVTSNAGSAPTANGYVETPPLSDLDLTLVPQTGTEASGGTFSTDAITVGATGSLTAFYATEPSGASGASGPSGASGASGPGAPGRAPVLVWCYDGQPSATNALLTRCEHTDQNSSDSTSSYTRFANVLADTTPPAVDVCVKLHSYGGYSGPLFTTNGVPGGLPAESLSGYFPVNGGYSYDVRYVAAGSADCSTSLADSTYMAFSEPGGGGYTTVLFTGYTTLPEDAGVVPPYDAGPGEDAGAEAGPQPVSVGITSLAKTIVAIEDESYAAQQSPAVRVVHVAADHPDPVGMSFVVSGEGTFSGSIVDVPYGGFSTEPGPVDPFGYEVMQSGTMTVTFDALVAPYTMGTQQTSMFVVHGANGAEEIIACNDWDEDFFASNNPTYADCCVVGSGAGSCPAGASGITGPSGASGPKP